jgi:hypothetical protein
MTIYTFYLLCCKSRDITDTYIGSTTNLTKRQYQHKYHTTNPNSLKKHQLKYKTIIENGGYDNWEYILLCCLDGSKRDCFHHEQHLIDMFNPTLNQRNPTQKTK